jgi:hypothetical protein
VFSIRVLTLVIHRPFVLLTGTVVVMILLVVGSVSLLYSVGYQEMPSTLMGSIVSPRAISRVASLVAGCASEMGSSLKACHSWLVSVSLVRPSRKTLTGRYTNERETEVSQDDIELLA